MNEGQKNGHGEAGEMRRGVEEPDRDSRVLRAVFESTREGIVIADETGTIADCNPAATAIFGVDGKELKGRKIFSLLESPGEVEVKWSRFLAHSCSSHLRKVLHSSGTVCEVEVMGVGNILPGRHLFVLRDVTEHRRSQDELESRVRDRTGELRKAKETLQSIIDHIPVMICFYDPSGKFALVNREFERLLGWSAEDMAQAEDMMAEFYPDPDYRREVWEYMMGAESRWRDFIVTTRSGGELESSWANVKLSDGSQIGIGIDITERRNAEKRLERYAAELERSNRELQEFAFVAAHDLQEPLRKIRTFGDLVKSRIAGCVDEAGVDHLSRMQKAAARMQKLITALLEYSRVAVKPQPYAPVDLTSLVREVIGDLETLIERTGGLVIVDPLATVEGDPVQLRQVFQNLIENALKFHGVADPVIRIHGRILRRKEKGRRSSPAPRYQVRVEDNGIGFDEKYLDRIFAPFQRLHGRSAYEGTGMGLAICRKIVERHGGEIGAESTPGAGSTFLVTLPLAQAGANAAA